MAKFLSDEYFGQLQSALVSDAKWAEISKTIKTSIAFNVTDIGQNYVLGVENGNTTVLKVSPGTAAEFSFDGPYEMWVKVAKKETDLQSAVLKGQIRFRGSITKILVYRDRFNRLAEIMGQLPAEF